VREFYSPRHESVFLLPRGNGKTTLMAALALFELLRDPRAAIVCAAATREQALHLFDAARRLALSNPAIREKLTITRRELRTASEGRLLVVSADAEKQLGWDPTLVIVDELCAHRDDQLYISLRTALIKRPDAKLVVISTAGVIGTGPLIELRDRCLRQKRIERDGVLTTARGRHLGLIEWALPDDWSLDRAHEANPASWITSDRLVELRDAVHESAFRRFHCNQWTTVETHWLEPGAWQACAAAYTIARGEEVWLGVDVGGTRSASAVVWVTQDLRVGVRVFEGDEAVLAVRAEVERLATEFDVVSVSYDPWRFRESAFELERRGLRAIEWPQTDGRMVPASEHLYAAVVERRLQHPDDEDLNRHVACAVAKSTARGWRLWKVDDQKPIDAVVALAMAVDSAGRVEPTRRSQVVIY
jgi:phage terminase large subunit-like protein